MQLRPSEIIYDKSQTRPEMLKILLNSPTPPIKSGLAPTLCYNSFKSISKLEGYLGEDRKRWHESLATLHDNLDNNELTFSSIGMVISYLENCLNDSLIKLFDYNIFDPTKQIESKMILDSQALEHLQILEVRNTKSVTTDGSLISIIDDTRTPFGKRLLKKWISSPLLSIDAINSRLDSIEDIIEHPHEMQVLRTKLYKLNDIEKQLSRLYQYSINRNKKAIYFEDVSLKKLKEFHDMLNKMKDIPDYIESFTKVKDELKSNRLKQLVTVNYQTDDNRSEIQQNEDFEKVQNDLGLFPDLISELEEFETMVSWKRVGNERIPEPTKGLDETFDSANEIVNAIKEKFTEILKETRSQFKNDPNINYSHAKFRYELEIPERYVKGNKKPDDYEYTSQRKGFQRFHTPEIKKWVEELEEAEEILKQAIIPFICSLFSHFHSKSAIWSRAVACLAELDCLCSIADYSMKGDGKMVRPSFIDPAENKYHSYLELRKMRHPGVVNTGVNFIPNDTVIGRRFDSQEHESENPYVLLITGPNMGGKSTLLRQTAIAVILAQIGCYVPADKCIMTPIDRIFTRIGASDRILEGKSVFYVELEETKQVLEFATASSLIIMDELGRGTSTFDGFSIAKSVLDYLITSVKVSFIYLTNLQNIVCWLIHDPLPHVMPVKVQICPR